MRGLIRSSFIAVGALAVLIVAFPAPAAAQRLMPLGPNKALVKLDKMARAAYTDTNYRETVKICTRMLQIDPDCGRAYFWRASAYGALKQQALAVLDFKTYARKLQKCPTANASDKLGALMMPQMLIVSTQYPRTDAGRALYIQDSIKAYGPGFVKDGKISFKNEHPTFRLQIIRDADIPAYKKLSETMSELTLFKINGAPEKALPLAKQVAAAMPGYSELEQTVGDCYLDMGKMPEAIRSFTKAITLNPIDPYNYYCRAVAYSQDGQYQKAIDDYYAGDKHDGERNRVIDELVRMCYGSYITPSREERHLRCGNLQVKLKHFDKAIGEFSTALQISPHYDEAYLGRAAAFTAIKNYVAAEKDYGTILKFNGEDERAYKDRGELYLLQGEPAKAIADFTRVIEIDPKESWRAYDSRAKAYAKLGKTALAEADRQMVIKSGYGH